MSVRKKGRRKIVCANIRYIWYVEYAFEDMRFRGLEEYEAYLSQVYGEFRVMPPRSERLGHGNRQSK